MLVSYVVKGILLWVSAMESVWEEETGDSLLSSGAKRLTILRGHLESGSSISSRSLEAVTTSAEIAPKFSGGAGTLTVVDNRTGKKYEFDISEGGTVKATDFKKVSTRCRLLCLVTIGFVSCNLLVFDVECNVCQWQSTFCSTI